MIAFKLTDDNEILIIDGHKRMFSFGSKEFKNLSSRYKDFDTKSALAQCSGEHGHNNKLKAFHYIYDFKDAFGKVVDYDSRISEFF